MQRIDQEAIETIGIPRLLLMDQAGLALAGAIQSLLPASPGEEILICCGSGYNGGDGLAAARHLERQGYRPSVVLATRVDQLREEPATFAKIARGLGIPILELESEHHCHLVDEALARTRAVVDALLGIGVRGTVRPLYAQLIQRINRAGKPVVSADVPSGLDADTGSILGAAIKATITVCFGLAKQGCLTGQGPVHSGRVLVDPISLPPRLLTRP